MVTTISATAQSARAPFRIPEERLDAIRAATDIAALVGETVSLRRSGKELVGLCPFHEEDDPSFNVNAERGLFHCHGCGKGGDAIAYVRERDGLGFVESVRYLAGRAGIEFPRWEESADGRGRATPRTALTLAALARDKALPIEFLREGCGLIDRPDNGHVGIPYRDERGQALAMKVRAAFSAKAGYKPGLGQWDAGWPKGKPLAVYGAERLCEAREKGTLMLVEGESDCWTLWYHGFTALGIPGATNAGTLLGTHLAGIDRLFVIDEGDRGGRAFVAGIAARLAALEWRGEARVVQMRAPTKDPNELHKLDPDGFPRAFRAALESAELFVAEKPKASPEATDRRPVIVVRKELAAVTDEALKVLGAGAGLYVRARLVVRVVRDCGREVRGIRRPVGAPVIETLTPTALRSMLDRAARWVKRNDSSERADLPPAWVAETILAATPNELPFELLEGVIETPALRPDGSVLQASGYDKATALLFEPCSSFPPVPAVSTLVDAQRATKDLEGPFHEFPFTRDSDRSAAIALVLTLLGRAAIAGPCPLFAFRAPTPGTGKSLLARALSLIGTGRGPAVWAPARDAEEERKRILSVLLSGAPAVLIDNVAGGLGSEALAAVLTVGEEGFTDRLLGTNKQVTAPARSVWAATGNNLTFRGDLARRVVPIDLDPKCERPEERTFKHEDLLAYIEEHRPHLVAAGLTILRAYHVAGRPRHKAPPMGSFEAWDRLVRGALVWAGCADPCAGRDRIREESDADLEPLRAVLSEWHAQFANEEHTLARAIDLASSPLREALAAADPRSDGKAVSPVAIGNKFQRWHGRIVDGLKLRRGAKAKPRTTWSVEKIGEV